MSIVAHPQAKSLEQERNCFHCDGKLCRNGKRERGLLFSERKEKRFVQRYRCNRCKANYTVLDEDMLPYKHYAASCMENSVTEPEIPNDCPAEGSTIRRWQNEFKGLVLLSLGKLMNHFSYEDALPSRLPINPFKAFRVLLAELPPDRRELFTTILEAVYWLSPRFAYSVPSSSGILDVS